VAARQTQGSIARLLTPIKAQLLELIALLEAGIDFAEDDISIASPAEILRRLAPILAATEHLAGSFSYGRLVRSGFSMAIVGAPNAGKSSLFNRLLQRERAIVTDIPGTTRDLVSETMEFEGIPVRLVDTAGIRHSSEPIERIGIERSYEAMSDADLTVVVVDGTADRRGHPDDLIHRARTQGRVLVAANKSDLPGFHAEAGQIPVSALTGAGVPEFKSAILKQVAPEGELELEGEFITNIRQEHLLREANAMLVKGKDAVNNGIPHELLLLDLYCALAPIDAITGLTTADDILNRIFANFCIGK